MALDPIGVRPVLTGDSEQRVDRTVGARDGAETIVWRAIDEEIHHTAADQ